MHPHTQLRTQWQIISVTPPREYKRNTQKISNAMKTSRKMLHMLLVSDVVRIVSIALAEINLEISPKERKSERVKEPSWQKWNHSLILKPLLASLDGAVLIDFCVPIAFSYSFFFFLFSFFFFFLFPRWFC